MKNKLKLFVWEDVLCDYTSGMMVAIAGSVEEARATLKKECSYIPDDDLEEEPTVCELDHPVAFVVWGGG